MFFYKQFLKAGKSDKPKMTFNLTYKIYASKYGNKQILDVRQTLITRFAILNYCLILSQKFKSYVYSPWKGVNMITLNRIIKSICRYNACNSCKKWYHFRCTNIGDFLPGLLTRKIKSSAVRFYYGLQDCNSNESYCLYQLTNQNLQTGAESKMY